MEDDEHASAHFQYDTTQEVVVNQANIEEPESGEQNEQR